MKQNDSRNKRKAQAMAEYLLILAILSIISIVGFQQFKNALEIYFNRVISERSGDNGMLK